MENKNCLFCKIISGEIPSTKIYEDDLVYGFKDINPEAPIHLLVIPKKHISSFSDLTSQDDEYICAIHHSINKIAKEQKFEKDGFRIVINCGENGGQMVKHLHYHILAGTKLNAKIV